MSCGKKKGGFSKVAFSIKKGEIENELVLVILGYIWNKKGAFGKKGRFW